MFEIFTFPSLSNKKTGTQTIKQPKTGECDNINTKLTSHIYINFTYTAFVNIRKRNLWDSLIF